MTFLPTLKSWKTFRAHWDDYYEQKKKKRGVVKDVLKSEPSCTGSESANGAAMGDPQQAKCRITTWSRKPHFRVCSQQLKVGAVFIAKGGSKPVSMMDECIDKMWSVHTIQ
jgi:hypothetical protein